MLRIPRGTGVSRMDSRRSLGQPRLLISRSALLHNADVIRTFLRPGTTLCGMIKAHAYGHAAALAADPLCNFARANPDDATLPVSVGVPTIVQTTAFAQ